jgi:hypothetical protein
MRRFERGAATYYAHVRRVLPALAILVLAGCGDGVRAGTSDDPGAAMTRIIRLELIGKRELSYALLVREQRRLVDRRLYRACSPGATVHDAKIEVRGVRDETTVVPALGRTKTKAVSWRLTVKEAGAPVTVSNVGHLIAEDGHWHWTLTAQSLKLLRAGLCP